MQIPVSAKNANGMLFLPNSAGMAMISENDRHRDHRVERNPIAVHAAEDRPAGDPAVARERVPGARGAGQPGRAAEHLTDGRDDQHQLCRPGVQGAGEDRPDESGALVDRLDVGRGEHEGEQDEPADHRRPEHRPPDALCGGLGGVPGLLRGVRRGVVAGLRVHGQQESDRQHQEPEADVAGRAVVEAGVVDPLAEHEAEVLVIVGDEDQQPDDDRDPDQVPANGDVVRQRQDPVAEDVHHRVEDQDQEEEEPGLPEDVLGVGEVDPEDVDAVEGERRVEEDRRAVSHRGDDPHQPDDVEPAGHPAPALAAEVVGPPVGPSGSRVPRGQLGH